MTIPAQRSFPYDNTGGDAGPYDADYFALIQQAHLGAYTRRTTAGVLLGVGNGTQESLLVEETSPQSMGVLVREGWAMVNGRSYQASEDITVAIVQNNDPSGDDRIDSIVVRIDKSAPSGTLVAKQGTVAPAPVPPSLTQNATVWEIRIADIDVINGESVVTTADIDNTVREYAVKRSVKEGGTGLDTIALGEMLMADANDSLAAIPAISDFAWLIGDTAKTPRARFVSMRPHIVEGSTGLGTIGTGAGGTVIPLDSALLNPNSFISSVAGNQFFLTAGWYLVSSVCCIVNGAAAVADVITWIHNATSGAVIAQSQTCNFDGANISSINAVIMPTLLQSNGTDAFELRGMRSGGGAGTGSPAGTLTPTGGYASAMRMVHLIKLKI